MIKSITCALLALCLFAGLAAAAETPLFNADGYRQTQYRSPTPKDADGATTLDTAALQSLLRDNPRAVLIDVYRQQWLNDRFIPEQPAHANLPGSTWLANVGDGQLEPRWQAYFEDNLERLSEQRKDRPLVFYCKSDCWLSWNAIKRARSLGYNALYWYRDGIDAWHQAGLPLQPAQAVLP